MTARRTATLVSLSLTAGIVAVLLGASPAAAHTGNGGDGFLDDLLHPLTGLDHVLVMLAVGVVGALVLGLVLATRRRAPSDPG
jgi:hydrogenase/urease accessory protein HupE